jgi:Family of unknown function (DUF6483)
MIRRDYIIRMVEEFARMLARIRERLAAHNEGEAAVILDQAFLALVGTGPEAVSQLSETELIALLAKDEPTQVVKEKSLMLVALLEEAAQLNDLRGREAESQACRLKALDLSLALHAEDLDSELPSFVPRIGRLHEELGNAALPLRTRAALWRFYEMNGAYARSEDELFALLEAEPHNEALQREGLAFYQRLLLRSDAALESGNLPRAEVEAALSELNGLSRKGKG